jgi:hypothetical protein
MAREIPNIPVKMRDPESCGRKGRLANKWRSQGFGKSKKEIIIRQRSTRREFLLIISESSSFCA